MDPLKRQHLKGGLASISLALGRQLRAPLFPGAAAMSAIATAVGGCQQLRSDSDQVAQLHAKADAIIASIRPTSFPARDFVLTDFIQTNTGSQAFADVSTAITKAIAACHQAGGGRVLIPAGRWLTGAIHLRSNVNLHLAKDAVLVFSSDPAAYLPYVMTRWEGVELMGYSPLIYAFEQDNIAITGAGILEGGGSVSHWWPWKGKWKHTPWQLDASVDQQQTRDPLFKMAEAGVPVSERVFERNWLRPPFIQPYRCSRVLVEGVTIRNSPFWLLNPVLCSDVIVRQVNFFSHGPNSDGCDPESCNRVLISDCLFDTGDDCIALKSGRNNDGRRLATPVQNVVIQDCVMKAGHGGVVLGSEISGGARNIFARRLSMSSPDLERGLRIKTNSLRGGVIDTVLFTEVQIGEVKDAIVINFYYEEGDAGDQLPQVKNIYISQLHIRQANRLFEIRGLPRAPVGLVQLDNVSVGQADLGVVSLAPQLQLQQVSLNGQPLTLVGQP
jgi:polygalacturonase